MKYIERKTYLDRLKGLKNTPDIKIITGIRRAGKSELMHAFMDYLGKTDNSANIIYVDYYDLKFDDIKDYKALNDYVYSDKSANDDKVEFANKCIQLACMKKYEECLRARLENAGVHFVNGHYLEDVAKIEVNPNEESNGDNEDKQVVLE